MRKYIAALLLICMFLHLSVSAESIHFVDDVYGLKYRNDILSGKIKENLYFKQGEDNNYWTGRIGTYYHPEVSNPLKFAADFDKEISEKDNILLLKFIQNKKRNIAVLSYLENVVQNDGVFFIYHICKYEKHPKKGMMILKFDKKYVSGTKDEIMKIGEEIKRINDDYMERIIISPIPPVADS